MKQFIQQNTTSKVVTVFIQNNSVTTGAGLTGLVYNTSGLTCYYFRDADGSSGNISLVSATLGTYTSSGFIVVDGTNLPGVYQLGLPAACLSALGSCVVYLQGAANMAPCVLELEIVAFNPNDAVHLGLSALPNTACAANASLITSGTGTAQLSTSSGVASANVTAINAVSTSSVTTVNANVGTTQAITFDANNYQKVDVVDIAGSAVNTSSAQLGVNAVNIAGQAAALDGNNYLKVDVVDIAGSAVNTSSAQLGVNAVNIAGQAAALDGNNYLKVDVVDIAGSAVNTSSAQLGVNAVNIGGQAAALDTNNYLKVDVVDIAGTASAGTAGYVGIDWSKINAPTTTQNLSGTTLAGVTVTTNNDKTGYSLSSSGVDGVTIETGLNLRQAIEIIVAAVAGVLSGADGTTITIEGAGVATTRIVATVDSFGNRSAVTLTP